MTRSLFTGSTNKRGVPGRELTRYSSDDPVHVHKNAKLTPAGRAVLVKRIEAGELVEVVARAMGVSVRFEYKWLKRFREEGDVGFGTGVENSRSPAPDPARG